METESGLCGPGVEVHFSRLHFEILVFQEPLQEATTRGWGSPPALESTVVQLVKYCTRRSGAWRVNSAGGRDVATPLPQKSFTKKKPCERVSTAVPFPARRNIANFARLVGRE